MSPDAIFTVANAAVLPGWLLLIFAPGWTYTRRLVPAVIAVPLALCYVYLLATHWGDAGDFNSLAGVGRLFADPYVLLGGWIHYLAFDLFVGAWIARDAQRAGIPHLAILPCLLLSFLLGPAGLLLYWLIRGIRNRQYDLSEA
jgi:hypothetical protein